MGRVEIGRLTDGQSRFRQKVQALRAQLGAAAGEVRLQKPTSNLFRGRNRPPAARLDVRAFNQVLDVDPKAGTVDTEGMTSYERLADACFARGVLPAVVPQLKSITIGGACAGLGIEASSFRYGLAHETVEEMEILLANGDIVLCTPDNAHSDLFFGFPNSFGTLGYCLRVKAKVVPVRPYVEVTYIRHANPAAYFRALEDYCSRKDVDFVDGVVFAPGEHYLSIGRFVDEAPYTSDYTYMSIYYRSIRQRAFDYLKTLDYIWRWDTDWFWCSRVLFLQNPLVRRLLGRKRLNSTFYKRVIDWNDRYRLRQRLRRFFGTHSETIIQDVDVPVQDAPAFLDFFQREIGLEPVWICPFRACNPAHTFPLFPTDPNRLYVNFGFWDAKTTKQAMPEGHFNRLIEQKLTELGGIKSLYSDCYMTREEFWQTYNGAAYERLKAKYDPGGRLSDLYSKCVLRH